MKILYTLTYNNKDYSFRNSEDYSSYIQEVTKLSKKKNYPKEFPRLKVEEKLDLVFVSNGWDLEEEEVTIIPKEEVKEVKHEVTIKTIKPKEEVTIKPKQSKYEFLEEVTATPIQVKQEASLLQHALGLALTVINLSFY